jgi:hypothetical protein
MRINIILCLLGASFAGSAQSIPGAPTAASATASYEGFLRNLAVISTKSDSLDASGVKNHKLKQGVCDSLALSGADCALIFQIGVATSAQLQALDRQATAVINGVRAQHPHGAQAAGTVVPPPPPQLAQLQAQREALVKSATAALQQQLSPSGSAALVNRLAPAKH